MINVPITVLERLVSLESAHGTFSEEGAVASLILDDADCSTRTVRGYAELWGWSKSAVQRKLPDLYAMAGLNAPELPAAGYVYLMLADTGEYKIGRSEDPERRLTEIAKASPHAIELVHVIPADDAVEAERKLHDLNAATRIKGEWFALTPKGAAHFCSLIEFAEGRFVREEA